MQIGTVINLNGYKKSKIFLKQNKLTVLVFSVFIISFITFLFLSRENTVLNNYGKFFVKRLLEERSNVKFFKVAVNSFFSYLLIIAINFSFGTSMFGIVFIPLIVAYLGAHYGIISTFLYANYSLTGIAFHAVIILPSAVVFIAALFYSARACFDFSFSIARITFSRNVNVTVYESFKKYCIKHIYIIFLVLASALIDALISTNLITKFNF